MGSNGNYRFMSTNMLHEGVFFFFLARGFYSATELATLQYTCCNIWFTVACTGLGKEKDGRNQFSALFFQGHNLLPVSLLNLN